MNRRFSIFGGSLALLLALLTGGFPTSPVVAAATSVSQDASPDAALFASFDGSASGRAMMGRLDAPLDRTSAMTVRLPQGARAAVFPLVGADSRFVVYLSRGQLDQTFLVEFLGGGRVRLSGVDQAVEVAFEQSGAGLALKEIVPSAGGGKLSPDWSWNCWLNCLSSKTPDCTWECAGCVFFGGAACPICAACVGWWGGYCAWRCR